MGALVQAYQQSPRLTGEGGAVLLMRPGCSRLLALPAYRSRLIRRIILWQK